MNFAPERESYGGRTGPENISERCIQYHQYAGGVASNFHGCLSVVLCYTDANQRSLLYIKLLLGSPVCSLVIIGKKDRETHGNHLLVPNRLPTSVYEIGWRNCNTRHSTMQNWFALLFLLPCVIYQAYMQRKYMCSNIVLPKRVIEHDFIIDFWFSTPEFQQYYCATTPYIVYDLRYIIYCN